MSTVVPDVPQTAPSLLDQAESLLVARDGKLTRELLLAPGGFGL
jgi:hypothetical protein